jgi:two-component system, chemotaxis family, sensor kinase CheA
MSNDMGMDQDELQAILEEFFTEADENLDKLEQDLIQLEALAGDGATDLETVNRIFRALHTLKGGAGFLGLEKIAKLAHAGENLLDEVRNDKVHITKGVMDALLETNDALKVLLGLSKNRADDSGVDNSALIVTLTALAEGHAPVAAPAPAKPAAAAPAPTPALAATAEKKPFNLMDEIMNDPILNPELDKGDDGPAPAKSAPAVASAPAAPAPTSAGIDPSLINQDLLAVILADDTLDPSRDKGDDSPSAATSAAATVAVAAPILQAAAAAAPADDKRTGDDRRQAPRREGEAAETTIRVEVGRLDKVMNLVGELVLARNTLVRQLNFAHVKAELDRHDNGAVIYGMMEQLSRVTQDLQMSVLSTRMQPIKKVFDKIPRQVRELKTKLGKEVNLIIEGEMTEVDKSLVEELGDPMVHMIRNALDHGLETPDERTAVGKHPEGTLAVRAFYEGNNVVIQVQEDGKGIDPVRIRQVAIKKGVVSESVAAAMSDAEAVRLIMAPGFSTAEKITDVSGRGVGMDVVNTKIADLQGSIDIRSEYGVGTCFSIYMPLTLAIVNALVVGAQEEGFAIPIGDISEVIKFKRDGMHRVNEQDIIELRGEPLPLYYLAKLTKHGHVPEAYNRAAPKPIEPRDNLTLDELEHAVHLATQAPVGLQAAKPDAGFVVVVRDGTSAMGLVVDELLGQEEVVVKPVTDMFEYNKAISGATITGDGKVHMILDVPFLLKGLSGAR